MSIRIVHSLSEPIWRGIVGSHAESTTYHTPELFEVFARTKGHRPQLRAAMDGDRVLALLLSIQIAIGGRILRFLTTSTDGMSPLAASAFLAPPIVEGRMWSTWSP